MGGVAYIESTIAEPGVIAQMSGLCRLAFGELNGDRSERAEPSTSDSAPRKSMPYGRRTSLRRYG